MQDGFGELNLHPVASRRYRRFIMFGVAVAFTGFLTWASFTSGDPHNTIYYATGVIAVVCLVQLLRETRKIVSGLPQARIDSAGLRLFYPSALFWPWERIKGARTADGSVIVDLHEHAGVDQGEWNRTEVALETNLLECVPDEIVETIERGVRLFGSA